MAENHQGARFDPRVRPFWSRLQLLGGPGLLFLIVTCGFWKIILSHRQYTWLDGVDLTSQVLPWFQFEAGEIHQGHLPLWDPYEWGGQALIGQAQPAVAYPLNWLLYAMPLKHGWVQQASLDWFFILIHYTAGLFCYCLCRDLGRSTTASLLGGSAFALSGWLAYTDWPQMLNGGAWAPLVFLFFFRMMRGERPLRSAAVSGAMLGISFLSGHHQIPIFTGLAIGGVWIYWLLVNIRKHAALQPILVCLGAFVLMFGLLGALQILPASDYGHQAVRWVGANNVARWKDKVPYRVHASLSMPPASILGLVVMPFAGNTNPYTGFAVLLLSLGGIVSAWKNVSVRILSGVALGGFLLALGQWSIFHGLLYSLLPQVDKARNVAFGAFVLGFGLSVLAAFGLDGFAQCPASWKRGLASGSVFAGLLLVLSPFFLWQSSLPKTGDYNIVSFSGFLALLIGATLFAWHKGVLNRGRQALLVLGILEFGTCLGWGLRTTDAPDSRLKVMASHSEIAQWLRKRSGPVRVELDADEIPYNFGDWYGIEVYGGYLASLSTNVLETLGEYPARVLMGVRYDVARKPLHPDREVEVFRDRSGLKIWEHTDTFPRVWSVHQARSIPKREFDAAYHVGIDRLLQEAFFVDHTAPAVENCSGDSVDLIRREANLVEIDATMNCKGLVIAAETFDSGWRATVDGRRVPLLEAYGIARAVVVPAGHHRIQMTFYSPSIIWGAILTTIGFFIMLLLAFL